MRRANAAAPRQRKHGHIRAKHAFASGRILVGRNPSSASCATRYCGTDCRRAIASHSCFFAFHPSLQSKRGIHFCYFYYPAGGKSHVHAQSRGSPPDEVRPRTTASLLLTLAEILRFEPLENRRLLAVVTVTTLSDTINFNDGVTSLREAMFATNTVPGADTIDFAPSLTAGGTAKITLSQGELSIIDSLAINGPGASLLSIDAAGKSRIFNIANKLGDVAISGLTLTHGSLVDTSGGAIFASVKNLQLSGIVATNNTVGKGNGGAVAISDAISVRVENSEFAANIVSNGQGGGLYTVSPTIVVDSHFASNSAVSGGGIATHGAFELTDSSVELNTASQGGGVWIGSNGNLTVTNTLVRKNAATFPMGSGQGHGGGIGGDGCATITGSLILENSSQSRGGGVGVRNQLTIENSIISGNTSPMGGGGIYTKGDLVLRSSLVSGNSAGGTAAATADGGGVYIPGGGTTTIESSTISGNFAGRSGGGVRSGIRCELSISSTRRSAVIPRRSGAGINGGTVTLRHSTVTDNSAITINNDLGTVGGINAHRLRSIIRSWPVTTK